LNLSAESILNLIDLEHAPDETRVSRVNAMWYGWLRDLVSSVFNFNSWPPRYASSEAAVSEIVTAIEKKYLEERDRVYPPGSSGAEGQRRGLYVDMFAAVVCLLELRLRFPYTEMDDAFLSMLGSPHIHIRTASGLALLTLGNRDTVVDPEGLLESLENGAFFAFPLQYYFRILNNLYGQSRITKQAAKQIRSHFDRESYDLKEGNYTLFKLLETAIFLAQTGELSHHALGYLVYLSEGNVRNDVELAYVNRIRSVLVALVEESSKARQTIRKYMLEEASTARGWEFVGFFKAWIEVDWQHADKRVVVDFLSITTRIHYGWQWDAVKVIIQGILSAANHVPLVVSWFGDLVKTHLEATSAALAEPEDDPTHGDPEFILLLNMNRARRKLQDSGGLNQLIEYIVRGLDTSYLVFEFRGPLLKLAEMSPEIELRYKALSTLLHYEIEHDQVKAILRKEKHKTATYMILNPYWEPLHTSQMETKESVSAVMNSALQYRPFSFDEFSC